MDLNVLVLYCDLFCPFEPLNDDDTEIIPGGDERLSDLKKLESVRTQMLTVLRNEIFSIKGDNREEISDVLKYPQELLADLDFDRYTRLGKNITVLKGIVRLSILIKRRVHKMYEIGGVIYERTKTRFENRDYFK